MAWHRSRQFEGSLILRNEDLDPLRCKAILAESAIDDMRWLGLSWEEGPDVGGPHGPYQQSVRTATYESAWRRLLEGGHLFPCTRSRKELRTYAQERELPAEDPVYPEAWRPACAAALPDMPGGDVAWRFRVPHGRAVTFIDGCIGETTFVTGRDFGDFVLWRRDGVPAYELAVVVDDIEMGVTEVVRGEDLLLSTARQILLYEAMGARVPMFFHCPLLLDADGQKLSKSLDARSIMDHRASGADPSLWIEEFERTYKSL